MKVMRTVALLGGWLATGAFALNAVPALAASIGHCGPGTCVLVARLAGAPAPATELHYTPGTEPDSATWSHRADSISDLGGADWQPIVGDFNNDGLDDLAVYRDGVFRIDRNVLGRFGALPVLTHTLPLGAVWNANSIPVVGDWDGVGGDDLGLYTEGKFTLFPDSGDLTDTITIDFGFLPQVDSYVFAQMPIAGPLDNNEDGIARVGVYFGNVLQYAPQTTTQRYNFYKMSDTEAVVIEVARPALYIRATVMDVSSVPQVSDYRFAYVILPDLGSLDQSVCEGLDFSCVYLFPERPDNQQPVVVPTIEQL